MPSEALETATEPLGVVQHRLGNNLADAKTVMESYEKLRKDWQAEVLACDAEA